MKKFKLNIIDLLVIFIIIILVIASVAKFRKFNSKDTGDSKLQTIEYTVKISGIRDYSVDAFEVGDEVYDSQTNVKIGKIIDKKSESASKYQNLENGTSVKSIVPGRYDLFLVVETEGTVNSNGYYANKTVELKVGSEKKVETLYAISNGKICNIAER